MNYIYFIIIITFLALIYMRFEAGFVKVEKVAFTKKKNGLKILQLSDIHINHLKVPISRVKRIIEQENPDLVVITGDYIEKPKNIPKFLAFLDAIGLERHIYICMGNHDYKAFQKKDRVWTILYTGLSKQV